MLNQRVGCGHRHPFRKPPKNHSSASPLAAYRPSNFEWWSKDLTNKHDFTRFFLAVRQDLPLNDF